jgi:hypothetical protein
MFASMAIEGGTGFQIGVLALRRWKAGDSRAAATLYRAEARLAAADVYPPANLAIVLARDGLCVRARDALDQADARAARSSVQKDRKSSKTPGEQ